MKVSEIPHLKALSKKKIINIISFQNTCSSTELIKQKAQQKNHCKTLKWSGITRQCISSSLSNGLENEDSTNLYFFQIVNYLKSRKFNDLQITQECGN